MLIVVHFRIETFICGMKTQSHCQETFLHLEYVSIRSQLKDAMRMDRFLTQIPVFPLAILSA